uniref:NADH dehydrogenase [ubiquinone] 1 alpha subcomplex subunit 3 n=1 Tax=Rhinolophus ferrumequinum TaxID=59479 RepID=A0A671FHM6_RHIFE
IDQDGGKIAAFLKNAWAKEPVLVVAPIIGRLDIILPLLSPYTDHTVMINQAILQLPAPSETRGMADVPATPDCQRPSLEWLKKL